MKTYEARFFRENIQLQNGGYETSRKIEAKTLKQAQKKADEICEKQVYGGMYLLSIEEVKQQWKIQKQPKKQEALSRLKWQMLRDARIVFIATGQYGREYRWV